METKNFSELGVSNEPQAKAVELAQLGGEGIVKGDKLSPLNKRY